ncbi:MAG: hypothetical protein PF637_04765 [Spirochaetes bacterium]|jgi:hypothetical protein|nr:hypothetical protein [Spirochaetota bacterium]
MKKFVLSIIFLIIFPLQAADLKKHISEFGYDFLHETVTETEFREINKVSFDNKRPVYNDRLIKLYLIASEINSEPRFTRELKNFESVIETIRPQVKGLSSYHRAEKILHLLHDIYFKTEITGSGAGYNIGIEDTLTDKRFNCYKSALIYNAVLDYFGYESYLVIVPDHIYSVILTDGKQIEVETTNRYGFDPYDRGAPEFKRALDKPGVTFSKKNYRTKTPIDNISVISIIYNSRLLLYTGQRRFSGYPAPLDHKRAAALGVLGLYIHQDSDNISNNILFPFYRINSARMAQNPDSIIENINQFKKLLAHERFSPYRPMYNKNISIALLEVQPAFRESSFGRSETLNLDQITSAYIASLELIENNSVSDEVTSTAWNNITIDFNTDLEKKISFRSIDDINDYTTQQKRLFTHFEASPQSSSFQKLAKERVTVMLNNYILNIIESKDYEKALRETDEGINLLKNRHNFFDEKVMNTIAKNRSLLINIIEQQKNS